jgi:hypothetical protein
VLQIVSFPKHASAGSFGYSPHACARSAWYSVELNRLNFPLKFIHPQLPEINPSTIWLLLVKVGPRLAIWYPP